MLSFKFLSLNSDKRLWFVVCVQLPIYLRVLQIRKLDKKMLHGILEFIVRNPVFNQEYLILCICRGIKRR